MIKYESLVFGFIFIYNVNDSVYECILKGGGSIEAEKSIIR
jgi:hypothetical protein